MEKPILHVDAVRYVRNYVIDIRFDNGTEKTVDIEPLLTGPVFEPLKDHGQFCRLTIDPISKTIVWPNGADLAPEALYDLPNVEHVA